MALSVFRSPLFKPTVVPLLIKSSRSSASVPVAVFRSFGLAVKKDSCCVPVFTIAIRQLTVSPVHHTVSSSGGGHATLWKAERILSVALLGIIPAGLLYPSLAADTAMAIGIVMHQHWGLEAIVTDYVRPILFGNFVPKLAHGLLLILSAVTLGGLLRFNYNDIGIGGCVRKIWSLKTPAQV